MSAVSNPPFVESNMEEKEYGKENEKTQVGTNDFPPDNVSVKEGSDILALQDTDPALNAKMHIVNNVGTQSAHSLPSRYRVAANLRRPLMRLDGRITTGASIS